MREKFVRGKKEAGQRDHDALVKAIKAGKVAAVENV
jgi:hypothetical protein